MSKPNDACLAAHIGAENAHDVDAIMDTYGDGAFVEINGRRIDGSANIRCTRRSGLEGTARSHRSPTASASASRQATRSSWRSALEAVHACDYADVPASGAPVAIPFCAIYQFDGSAKLASERVYLDIAGALSRPPH
jgi:hypothetical protein